MAKEELFEDVTCPCGRVIRVLKTSQRKFCCRKCFRKWYKETKAGLHGEIGGQVHRHEPK